jgi:uncharacterized membrane protein
MQKDGNDKTKGAVSGALLGGLMAGPFGALWGAQIGGVMGANNRAKRVQADELAAMGLSEDTMRLARQTAAEIEAAESSLAIVKRADNSQRTRRESNSGGRTHAVEARAESHRLLVSLAQAI